MYKLFIFLLPLLFLINCKDKESTVEPEIPNQPEKTFYFGSDLSFANEMEDCGATFKNSEGQEQDVFKIFSEAGNNLVRVRLWNNPDWTNYSNLEDVKKTIRRAKALKMDVLLDFHYSDTWADPEHQIIPNAWRQELNNTDELGKLLYDYTYDTLLELENENLLPDLVQVGNEINSMLLQENEEFTPMNWERNASLINQGIKAVRDLSKNRNKPIEVMLHIAQPENALWWFKEATANQITDYDWIGVSYYPKWSEYNLATIDDPLKELITTYNKKLMIVEVSYPFTIENADNNTNIIGGDALLQNYPATEEGQLSFLNDLATIVYKVGGSGVVYWAPDYVSTDCVTKWGDIGSPWDNATLFNFDGKATKGLNFLNLELD